jgi:5-(carboxyamino)imidazole ribonucleotide synthase
MATTQIRTIGILGAGQLGMMLCQSLKKLGAQVITYDPDKGACGHKYSDKQIYASYEDKTALQELATICDAVTYEFEHLPAHAFEELEKLGKLFPGIAPLRVSQNRGNEKDFFAGLNLPQTAFKALDEWTQKSLKTDILNFGFPIMLKTQTGGYDGKGQWRLLNEEDVERCLLDLTNSKTPLILERLITITKEASIIIARNKAGETTFLPVFENSHKDSTLDTTICPANIDQTVQEELHAHALKLAEALNVIGLLTVEYFLDKDSEGKTRIYLNEIAPRPHNSGHVSREACDLSQFDLLARILLELPLQTPALKPGTFCMKNLMGDLWFSQTATSPVEPNWSILEDTEQPTEDCAHAISLTLYGKAEARKKRKMGHFVLSTSQPDKALELCEKVTQACQVKETQSVSVK